MIELIGFEKEYIDLLNRYESNNLPNSIFIVVVVEMAQITPPIGFNLFVLQGMTGHEMSFIARAGFAMFLIMVLMVFVLIAFPELATWLPENIRQQPG